MAYTDTRQTERDWSTQSNYQEFRTKNLDFDWTVDFATATISGSVKLDIEGYSETTQLILDTRDLTIEKVEKDGETLKFTVGDTQAALGQALTITLPQPLKKGDTTSINITYKTSPQASALCWMPAEQTDGGKQPYLYSQCQAIHARSVFPCQDTPSVRATYTATVKVPAALTALMSALVDGSEVKDNLNVCKFKQPVGIPSYLVAIAVGELASREISPRVRVWAEPCTVDKVAYEFAETEEYVQAGESLVGEYVWTRYDILCLPASFPYGGMENPCLTFCTPTLLAGDRSLTHVIAHEASHSWTGNLVTNATWEDFWLNEGCTMYLQRSIQSVQAKNWKLYDFDAATSGWFRLKGSVDHMGNDHRFTCLRPNLKGEDPDDAFSTVPYEKGFFLLNTLQTLVGGREKFLPWFKSYIQDHKYKCITSNDFRAHFEKTFPEVAKEFPWKKWFDEPGMPERTQFSTEMADQCTALAEKWTASGGEGCTKGDIDGWLTTQFLSFLDILAEKTPAKHEMLDKLDATFALSATGNTEIKSRWLTLALQSDYTAKVLDVLRAFLVSNGRMKFVRPLYRLYFKVDQKAAVEHFQTNIHRYQAIAIKMLKRDMGLE